MAKKQFTFQFARVLIISNQVGKKINLFSQVFSIDRPISDRFNKYLFLDVEEMKVSGELFFVGRLVKYKAIEEEVVIENSRSFGSSVIDDAVVAKPEFVLHPISGILAFRTIPSRFSASQFRDKFAGLVDNAFDNFFINTKVEPVNEDFEIQEQFKKFRTVKSINIELHPSNPHNRDLWKKIDDKIKAINAINYQQKITGGSNGLDKDRIMQDEIYDGMLMAADGYGNASIDGILDDGRHVTITTADNPTEIKTTVDGLDENLIERLSSTFKLIWNRTNNEKNG